MQKERERERERERKRERTTSEEDNVWIGNSTKAVEE